nr:hypothetical protein B0A51_16760 [Rachicladosporium sp. CCFEE 5018]
MAASHSRAHWLVPTTLVLATIVGVALAYGHHLFYSTLNGTKVSEARWTQDTNISMCTAFTFLVRCALVIAVSAAYWQVFWRRLHRPLPLSNIDDLSTQLKDIYQLLNFNNIKISPLLCTLALLAWFIPVSVVFPPSALKIAPQSAATQQMTRMRVPDYNASNKFVPTEWHGGGMSKRNGMGMTPLPVYAYWAGPSSPVRRALLGTAYQGQLPMITLQTSATISPNSSYALEFNGPALQCDTAMNASGIAVELTDAGALCLNGSLTCANAVNSYFVSWVANGSIYNRADDTSRGGMPYAIGTNEPEYLGTDPLHPQAIFAAYRDNESTKGADSGQIAILNCTLYNATYALALNYMSGEQSVTINSVRAQNAVSIVAATEKGQRAPEFPGAFSLNDPETDHTQILSTDLAFTHELWPVYRNYSGLDPNADAPKKLRPFKDTLEELFQNMTLSLLSIPSVLAPQDTLTPVSVSYTHNAYVYTPQRLWAPYGAAIVATLIVVTVGFFSMAVSGASYSNNFSTIIRVSHDRAIDIAIRDEDRFGQDPLPKYIA